VKYCYSLGMLLLLIGNFAGVCLAAAAETESAKTVWGSGGPSSDWNAQLSIGQYASSELRGIHGDVAISDYRLKLIRNIKFDERTTLTLGGGYGLKHIDGTSSASLPEDLHAIFMEVGGTYRINDRAFASIKLYPGLYSDFRELDGDALRMPSLVLGGYSFENGLSVVAGFIYRFGYHSSQYIPALGFSYQAGPDWKIDLVAPRPSVTYSASRRLQLFVAGDFASDEYELKDRSIGARAIKYGDYKGMAGFNYMPAPAVKLSTTVGYAFERKFVFYNGNRPDVRVDDAPFLKISLEVGW